MEASEGGVDEAGQLVKNKFYDFILESTSAEENETTTLQQRLMIDYKAQISSMIQNDKTTLFVSYQHLKEFDYELMEGERIMDTSNLVFLRHLSILLLFIHQYQLLKWSTTVSSLISGRLCRTM